MASICLHWWMICPIPLNITWCPAAWKSRDVSFLIKKKWWKKLRTFRNLTSFRNIFINYFPSFNRVMNCIIIITSKTWNVSFFAFFSQQKCDKNCLKRSGNLMSQIWTPWLRIGSVLGKHSQIRQTEIRANAIPDINVLISSDTREWCIRIQ